MAVLMREPPAIVSVVHVRSSIRTGGSDGSHRGRRVGTVTSPPAMGVSVPVMTACSGFLLAVLWMDVMFDVQVLPHRHEPELPEATIESVAGYYHRVTTTSRPMSHLVAGVMAILLIALGLRAAGGRD